MAHEYCDGGNLEQAIHAGVSRPSCFPSRALPKWCAPRPAPRALKPPCPVQGSSSSAASRSTSTSATSSRSCGSSPSACSTFTRATRLTVRPPPPVLPRPAAHERPPTPPPPPRTPAGDLHPRNVLFKSYVQSARAASKTVSLAEAHTQAHVRDVYAALARGFTTKVTDAGLALKMWAAGEELPAHYDETLRFYTAPVRPRAPACALSWSHLRVHAAVDCSPGRGTGSGYVHDAHACAVQEVLEYNSYSKAADVYSLGAILWEILHSRPCYRRTVVGFPVRHPDFPKFSDTAPLPYAALTAACLHSNPSLRYAAHNPGHSCCAGLHRKRGRLAGPQRRQAQWGAFA